MWRYPEEDLQTPCTHMPFRTLTSHRVRHANAERPTNQSKRGVCMVTLRLLPDYSHYPSFAPIP
jgi:hypothetical protein